MQKHLLVGFAFVLALSGCSKDKDDKKGPEGRNGGGEFAIFEEPQATGLRVTDLKGNPIAGAKILIGTAMGAPYSDNFLTADANGAFTAPAAWTDAQPVTVSAPGYIRVTYFGQTPHDQAFVMRPSEGTGNFELSGATSGFTVKNGDGLVDFGVVAPAFARRDFYSFDVWSVVSPENDQISIIGKTVDLPSNIVLPQQRENYFLPINLNKPNFRTFFKSRGTKKVIALRGQFPLKKVVDGVQDKKDFTELINDFNITGGSLKSVNISNDKNRLDMPVNEMNFTQAGSVNAPNFRNTELLLGVALSQSGGVYFPTDIKNLSPNKAMNLKKGPGESTVLTVLRKKDESQKGNIRDRLSATLLPFSSGVAPKMLPMIDDPRLRSSSHIQVPAAQTIGGVEAVATYAALSNLKTQDTAAGPIAAVNTVWEVYGAGWMSEVRLPEWPKSEPDDVNDSDPQASGKMRWGVTLLGQSSTVGGSAEVGPALLESATHATHSSVDF